MSSTQLIRLTFIALAFLFGSYAAQGNTASQSASVKTAAGVITIAKSEKEKGKAKASPKKKPAKEKSGAKAGKKSDSKKDKPKAKAKVKDSGTGKALKAKAAPSKSTAKKKGKAAAAAAAAEDDFYDDDYNSEPSDAGFWFMLALGILAVCAVGFMLWLEYRPTVYPSGKTYGQFDYLPASKGGAFTTEYNGDPMAGKWQGNQPAPGQHKQQQPATVTREPLHATRKSEQVPRTKESA